MYRAVRTLAPALVLFAASAAPAQPVAAQAPEPANLRGDSTQTRKRLAEAEQKLLAGKAADAVDDLQRVFDESADDFITLDGREYRTARWVIHSLLARLPPDALKAYQDRIDQPAKKLLEQAKRDRDPRPLWQLLDRYFVSRPADDALVLLGDLLFERGAFRAAEDQWRRLLPDAGGVPPYPGSKADPALTRARVVLAVIFQNDPVRTAAELAAFEAKYPTATGTLAGKIGPLAATLRELARTPPKLPPDATGGTAWPTFGGAPDRAGRVPGGIPAAWPAAPTWQKELPEGRVGGPGLPPPPVRQPFGYPVIIDGEVFVTEGSHVLRYHLRTGEPIGERKKLLAIESADVQCALTAADGLLYARVGPVAVRPPRLTADGRPAEPTSAIACLTPKGDKLIELWRLAPPEDSKVPAAWEGPPLVVGRRLWAVYAKFEAGRVTHVLACYDPSDPDNVPDRPAWVTDLCDGSQPVSGAERTRQEILTLAGRHVVFCSNTGAVVAVDAATGRRAWGFRYTRTRKNPPGANSDPAPAVAFAGRVFVAPADGERVYALDAETGRLVWESGPTEGARIGGVSRGRLVVAVAGPLCGIRGLDLETGSYHDADGGWCQSVRLLSFGRGLVTDDTILWPTREGLRALDPRSGYPNVEGSTPDRLPNPDRGGFGHLAYADGVLVVATATKVCGYRAESPKVKPLPNAPPRKQFYALIERAERAVAAGDSGRAIADLADVAKGNLPEPFRAWAVARAIQLVPSTTNVSSFPAELQTALTPALLAEWVIAPDGTPVTVGAFLQRRIGRAPAAGSVPCAATDLPPDAPGLTADAEIDRTLKLPPAVAPLRPIPGAAPPKHLFAAGPRVVVAVPLDRTAETERAAADLFTHAADLGTGFVAAGPFAVALYGAARDPLWVFRVPTTDRLPDGPPPFRFCCGGEPTCPQLSAFALAGPWLFARVGEHHLVALDLTARRVAWVLDSDGRAGYASNLFPEGARFGPHFAVCGKYLVAQRSDGRRWFVDLRTGRPVVRPELGDQTARVWWPQAPVECGANRLLVADGPGLVRLIEPGTRVKWAFEADREEGLTGTPAQVWARGEVILVAVRRNHGIEIERVDAATGRSAWSGDTAFADADRIDLGAADADAERAYVPAANKLLAVALGTGKPAWEVDLPDARGPRGWVVRAGKTCVIAYPADAIPAEPPGAVRDRLARSLAREPFVWRLPGLAGTLYDTWITRAVPVLVFDPETGKRLARYDIPARGPGVTAHFGADAAVIATGDRVVWLR
jgi:outer membrane protein assembly factor BamB